MQFVNENTAYMCALEGGFVKTIDGGETWLDKSLSEDFNLNSLFFVNEDIGFLINAGDKAILRTTNGGNDWTISYLGGAYIFEPVSIYFINEEEGFATTTDGVLFKTTNGGDTWEEFYVFPWGWSSEIFFLTEAEGWYRCGMKIYHTFDGGATWIDDHLFGSPSQYLFFLDNAHGWIGGNGGLVATYDLTVDINEFNRDFTSVSVFPNPAHEQLEVKLMDKTDEVLDIKVFDLQGRQVLHFSNLHKTNSFKFNISGLISGAYILNVTATNRQYLVKFIKQ